MAGAITKYVDVVFDRDYKQVAPSVYRYDHGIALRVRGVPTNVAWQCHFSCRGNDHSVPVVATVEDNAVIGIVPDVILMQPREVICYLYYEDENFGRTVYEIFIPVQGRARPANGSYTPQQIDAYDTLVATLQSLINEMPDVATLAETKTYLDIE